MPDLNELAALVLPGLRLAYMADDEHTKSLEQWVHDIVGDRDPAADLMELFEEGLRAPSWRFDNPLAVYTSMITGFGAASFLSLLHNSDEVAQARVRDAVRRVLLQTTTANALEAGW